MIIPCRLLPRSRNIQTHDLSLPKKKDASSISHVKPIIRNSFQNWANLQKTVLFIQDSLVGIILSGIDLSIYLGYKYTRKHPSSMHTHIDFHLCSLGDNYLSSIQAMQACIERFSMVQIYEYPFIQDSFIYLCRTHSHKRFH